MGMLIACSLATPAYAEDVGVEPESAATFRAHEHLSLADLTRAVERGAPELAVARRELSIARGEARQARLLANPTLEAGWGTLPVGRLNPRGLERPYANVPNYAIGIEYTFPWRKRAARRRHADAIVRASAAELEFDTRGRALALAEVLGEIASATLRREGIADLLAGSKHATELADARLAAGFGTPLEVDQLRIELDRTEQLLSGAESQILENLAACAALVGMPCERFVDARAARAYLARWLDGEQAVPAAALAQRADLRALRAYADAAAAERRLAEAHLLPDPTVRLGYVHDRFTVSGNQLNSLNLSVNLTLPVFDRGQAKKKIAEAAWRHLHEERDARLRVAGARIPALLQRHQQALGRCRRLESELIPKAKRVLDELEAAVADRLLPFTQVLHARRVVGELFVEEADSCADAFLATVELARETPELRTKQGAIQ